MNLRWWGFLGTMVAITGAVGLQFVLTQLYPSALTQILLLVLVFITFAAVTIPVAGYANHRFALKTWRQKDPARLLRQGGEAGLTAGLMAYLQLVHVLDWTIAAVLIGFFVLMETYFLAR